MGYRLYLGGISKEQHSKLEDLDVQDWIDRHAEDGNDFFSVSDLRGKDYFQDSLFEFGKYFDVPELEKQGEDFFMNIDVEGDLMILDKQKTMLILDYVRSMVLEHYEKEKTALENFEKDREFPEDYKKEFEWQSPKAYLMEQNKNKIREWSEHINPENARFWEYQYFALMYLIGTFDFEKNHMVYYGW